MKTWKKGYLGKILSLGALILTLLPGLTMASDEQKTAAVKKAVDYFNNKKEGGIPGELTWVEANGAVISLGFDLLKLRVDMKSNMDTAKSLFGGAAMNISNSLRQSVEVHFFDSRKNLLCVVTAAPIPERNIAIVKTSNCLNHY